MTGTVRAVVQTAPRTFEVRAFAPPRVGDDDGVLRVEACGICGTDLETFSGRIPLRGAAVPGHEPVGVVEAIGSAAAARWGVAVGDRVVVRAEIGCGACAACATDGACSTPRGNHGFVPVDEAPGLWGGFAEMMYLAPGSLPLRIDAHVPARRAALFNLLGAGFAWAVAAPGLAPGASVAVLGPGQRGLACLVAAREVGAGVVVVTGRGSVDAHKLALARSLGADRTVDVEADDAVDAVMAVTGGRGADVVVDTTPHAAAPLRDAVAMVRPGGTIVLAGLKGPEGVDGFPVDAVAMKAVTLRGVRAVDPASLRRAIALLEADRPALDAFHTHHFGLEQAARAVECLGSPEVRAVAVTVEA